MSKGFWVLVISLVVVCAVLFPIFSSLSTDSADGAARALTVIAVIIGPVFVVALAVWVIRTGTRKG